MHFEDDVRTCFDELAFASAQNFGGLSRSVANQEIAGQRAGVSFAIGFWRRGKEYTGLLVLEIGGARFAKIRDDVVHYGAISRADFQRLNPFAVCKHGRKDRV